MSSFQITVDLCKVSGTKLAHFQTIVGFSVPMYVWFYENGAKELDPKHLYVSLISLNL